MTENQTVPSPSGLPQLSNATSTSTPEQNGDSSGEIQCICDYNDDDGYTICCDVCETWQHFACMQVEEEAVPSQYQCSNCLPRPVDAKQARELQRQRRKNDRGPKANNNQNNNTKRKRSSTTSHKKKEPQTNGSNGSVSTKTSQSTEKTGGTRVPSPRESQAPTGSRKRAQRASQTHPRGNSPGDFPGVINSLGASCTTDRNGDIESDTDFEKYKYEFIDISVKQLGLWIHNLLDKMGDCACAGGDECLLHRLRKDAKIDYFPPIKMPPTNGNSRKTKAKRQASSEPNGQKESTPDANDLHSRAGSVSTKVKSRSRDLTPSSLDTAVEPGTMTGREARKFKDVLSRIEKQQQEEHHPPPAKRRKRNSVVNNLSGNSATSPTSDNAKGLDGKNRRSSVFATISNVEISMVDAGTSRRTSDSSNSSSDRQKSSRNSKSPPGSSRSSVSSKASKATRKVVRKPSKAVYVDAAMQTEETDSELPWWRLPVQTIPPRPPRMTLRKKLLQSMQRDREAAANAATTAQDKKRKFDEITEVTSDSPSPPKVVKLPEEQSRRSISPTQPEALTPAVPVSCTDKMEIETINTVDSTIVKSTVPLTPHSPVGPSLTELFADSDRSRDTAAQEPKKQPSDLPQVNGTRPPGLHLQLPSSISVVNGPNTAMSLGTVTPSTATANSPPASSNASVFSPSVMCAMSSGGASSPIKTMKKLSLKDYGKRKHKAPDPVSDKKPDEISPESNISKPVVSLKDQSKIADILTPTEGTLAPQSQSSSMDPKIGVQRIANFGVR
ncbi:hypothetical protein EDC01DRAFT_623588 [Geopyxis carbonaria]|nr:hypothetical protein EDC01DRAFT_623588 [Geopyxis carbonaria]